MKGWKLQLSDALVAAIFENGHRKMIVTGPFGGLAVTSSPEFEAWFRERCVFRVVDVSPRDFGTFVRQGGQVVAAPLRPEAERRIRKEVEAAIEAQRRKLAEDTMAVIEEEKIEFLPDGSVRSAEGLLTPERLRELLPIARPWTRSRYLARARAAAEAGVPNADVHLRLVVETIGKMGQGHHFDAMVGLYGEKAAAAAVGAIEPMFDNSDLAVVRGDKD